MRGAYIDSPLAAGVNALKSFDPPLGTLASTHLPALGEHLILDMNARREPLTGATRTPPAGAAINILRKRVAASRLERMPNRQ